MQINSYKNQLDISKKANKTEQKEDIKQNNEVTKDFQHCLFCKAAEKEEKTTTEQKIEDPIASLADKKTGIYTYKGLEFQVDNLRKQIFFGDMAQGQKILSVTLSTGYTLKVNWNNIDDLAKCLDLFSPEDVNRIMNAIAIQSRIDQIQTGKDILKNMERNVKNNAKEKAEEKEKQLEELKKKLQESKLTALELKKLGIIETDLDITKKTNQLMALLGIF